MPNCIVKFYAPYTCEQMSFAYRLSEALIPVALHTISALVSVAPLLQAGYWLLSGAAFVVTLIVLRTIYSGMMHISSEPRDGGRYISPSVYGITELFAYILGMIVALAAFGGWAYYTGWLQLKN